jgi:hypothetical protein
MENNEKIILFCGILSLSLSAILLLTTMNEQPSKEFSFQAVESAVAGSSYPGVSFFYCTSNSPTKPTNTIRFPIIPNVTRVSAMWANPNPAEQDSTNPCNISINGGSSWISLKNVILPSGAAGKVIPWEMAPGYINLSGSPLTATFQPYVHFTGCPCTALISYAPFDWNVNFKAKESLCGGTLEYCCSDGQNNDGDKKDGKDLTDCADPDCSDAFVCTQGQKVKMSFLPEICGNFDDLGAPKDDDRDGLANCADPDCQYAPACAIVLFVKSHEAGVSVPNEPSAGWKEIGESGETFTVSGFTTVYFYTYVNTPMDCSVDCVGSSGLEFTKSVDIVTNPNDALWGACNYPATSASSASYLLNVTCGVNGILKKNATIFLPVGLTGPAPAPTCTPTDASPTCTMQSMCRAVNGQPPGCYCYDGMYSTTYEGGATTCTPGGKCTCSRTAPTCTITSPATTCSIASTCVGTLCNCAQSYTASTCTPTVTTCTCTKTASP